ncbi:MAG: DUF3299 domain-containing protein [Leptospirales bacterium]|nr:DUF3299 domain-containing protein [Leptospirales bacterium]
MQLPRNWRPWAVRGGLALLLAAIPLIISRADLCGIPPSQAALPVATELAAQGAVSTVDWRKLQELNLRTGRPSSSLGALNNRPVRIAGFMVPLEDEEAQVSEFLLVPYPQACIHVPAPPSNQIVHVKMQGNRKARVYWFEPVWVYGNLKIQRTNSIYAEAAFFLAGNRTELYDEPMNAQ